MPQQLDVGHLHQDIAAELIGARHQSILELAALQEGLRWWFYTESAKAEQKEHPDSAVILLVEGAVVQAGQHLQHVNELLRGIYLFVSSEPLRQIALQELLVEVGLVRWDSLFLFQLLLVVLIVLQWTSTPAKLLNDLGEAVTAGAPEQLGKPLPDALLLAVFLHERWQVV